MIHTSSDVQTTNIGQNTCIWQFCTILEKAVIGDGCNINCNVFIENDVVIGNDVTIKPGVQIWDGLRIADKVFIGPNATFTNDILPRSKTYPVSFAKTYIELGVSIGANATILSGITIGKYAMIGAGSVLTKSVPPYTLWYGNPAKHRGYVTKSGSVISLDLKDRAGKQYHINTVGQPLLS